MVDRDRRILDNAVKIIVKILTSRVKIFTSRRRYTLVGFLFCFLIVLTTAATITQKDFLYFNI